MPQPIAYLAFPGNCAEAMRFYAEVLGGTLDVLTLGQSPRAEQSPPGSGHLVMHARLTLPDGGVLYAGDAMPGMPPHEGIKGVSIALNFDSLDEAARVFAALGKGGSVGMGMQETFWARSFGMLTDRFGTPWLINGQLKPLPA